MRLFVQDTLVELEGQFALLRDIGLAQQLVVDTIEFRIFVIAVIRGADRVRLPGLDVDDRVDDAVAIAAGRDGKITAAQAGKPRTARHDLLRYL